MAGRCSTLASTCVNSEFRTGVGATTFTGPLAFSSEIAALKQAHYVIKRDPRHPLLAASQPPA